MIAANIAATAINIVGVKQRFKEGTLIACLDENGEEIKKPIEAITVGTMVLAYDEITGEQTYKKVVQLFRNETEEWYHIFVNGEEIICTGGHPFYVAELDKFIPARELGVGTKLLLSCGKEVIIEEVKVEQLETPETTYNFEVEDFHTYYVTESKVLVHNKCRETDNPLEDIEYSDKVKQQMKLGDNHSFPLLVDNYGALGKQSTFMGGDGKIYYKLEISGAYKGYKGNFEYIYDSAKYCNHRFFRRF